MINKFIKRLKCKHRFIRIGTITYLCSECFKQVRLPYGIDADIFEAKQILLGRPVMAYSRLKDKSDEIAIERIINKK